MTDEGGTTCRIAVLLASPDGTEVRIRDDAILGGPTLPSATVGFIDELPMERTIDVAGDILGRPIVPLRLTLRAVDSDRRPALIVVEVAPGAIDAADGGRWVSAEELRDQLLPADLRETLAWWLDRGGDVAGALPQAAWTRPGWFERASAWMAEQMALANLPPDGPPRVVYLWPLSVVLRAPSGAGSAYLKAAAPIFPHEASITAALAARSPDAVPEVLDVEPGENWLLMRDIGGSLLGDEPAPAWGTGLAAAARLQRAWEGASGELLLAGAARRPLGDLAEQVPAIVERLGLGDRVERDQHRAWRAAIPRLSAACARLEGVGVPETLVHGDLHPWNIARTPRGLVVFDWSDSAIGHPFVDLVTTVIRTEDVAVRRRLADAYLSAWPEVSRDDREAVAGLAMVVGSLYQVQSYLAIFDTLDPMETLDLDGADLGWLQRARMALDLGIAVPGRR